MDLKILSGGSKGNSIVLKFGDDHVLVDAGIAKTKIEKRLLEEGVPASSISAIYLTHEHNDHVQGVVIANKYRIPVFASEGTWKKISDKVDSELQNPIKPYETYYFDYCVTPFRTYHDAYDSFGYTFKFGTKKASICLDTGHVDAEMIAAMKDSDIILIESNHDPEMVEAGSYPDSVKARVISDIGHLSNEQTAEALQKLVKGKGERIYLTHLSSTNNMAALAELAVTQALKKKGLQPGKHYQLEVL